MNNDSIVKIVMIFIIYSFIVTTSYFLMSTPVELLFDGFDDADFGAAEDEKDTYMTGFRIAFTLAMAFFVSIPVTWFIMKIFSREPAYYQYRRY